MHDNGFAHRDLKPNVSLFIFIWIACICRVVTDLMVVQAPLLKHVICLLELTLALLDLALSEAVEVYFSMHVDNQYRKSLLFPALENCISKVQKPKTF